MVPTVSELYAASDSDPMPIVVFLQALASNYDLPQPLHALDLGCGPGRLLAPLERLRWQVTGMEPNPDFFASAHAYVQASRRVTVRHGGFLDLDECESFDLAIAVNSSFAHLVRPAERVGALQRIHDALRPGGVVFLDLPNFLWILKNYREPEPYTFTALGQSVTLHRRHDIDVHAATMTTVDDYVFARSGESEVQLVHTYGMATLPELQHHLHETGFTELRTFNGYNSRTGERLTGPRILVAAQKPPA